MYGVNSNAYILGDQQVVEIVLNNHDPGKHPFHLHGHAFQAVVRGDDDSGDYDANAVLNGSVVLPRRPMRRDTLLVRPNGHIVMRFKSDNPGVWLFHCHIEWHVDSGLVMTFVEVGLSPPSILRPPPFQISTNPLTTQSPLTLQKTLSSRIPEDHYAACAALSPPMPTLGNAAGNVENLYDLSGANVSPDPLPDGFQTKGIVAMTFSILAGLIGVGVVVWYGLGEMGAIEEQRERKKIESLARERGVVSRANTGTGGMEGGRSTAGDPVAGEEIARAG